MTRMFLLSLSLLILTTLHAQIQKTPEIGIVQSMENDSLLRAAGYRHLVENTSKLLSPRTVSDEQFQLLLKTIRECRVPVIACNIFIPGDLKVVGTEVNEKAVLDYVAIVLQRAQKAGLKMIIWGSGGSRRIPDGFDPAKAREQFIAIAGKIAALAGKYNVILAVESLNSSETNFINTLREAFEIARAVNHKNLRLCADFYHMLREEESPDIIREAGDYIVYAELAEKKERTPPGVKGDDFRPYLTALKNIKYKGKIVIECRWKDLPSEAAPAYLELKKQVADVFRE